MPPRVWYAKIDGYFVENGYHKSINEPTLYVKSGDNHKPVYVCLYVDDLICASPCASVVDEFKQGMKNLFEMTDLGLLKYFLGLEVHQCENEVFLGQEKYAKILLDMFGMINCNSEETPMNTSQKLSSDDGANKVNAAKYRSVIGGLIYLTHARPDLVYVVGVVARFMYSPSKLHLGVARRIMRYIAGALSFGMWYEKGAKIELVGYTDSDWHSCTDDRKSVSPNVFKSSKSCPIYLNPLNHVQSSCFNHLECSKLAPLSFKHI